MDRPTIFDPIDDALEALVQRLSTVRDGRVADYIPELGHADPAHFGVSLVSLDGNSYQAGDSAVEFTIQSISKAFTFALALSDLGRDAVVERVGVEPSGEAFNAISLDPTSGRPDNPLINAGAIVTSSLVAGAGADDRFERIRSTLSAFAGRELALDRAVLDSERATGDRNRALAYLMRNSGALTVPVDDALEVYFAQCSLLVTATDLATMAATLANSGRNPVTNEAVVSSDVAEDVMSVMATCGMYDASGDWLLRVGLPAKSGVAGGVVAISPGQFGIGAYSPPLDELGNSVRATLALRALSEEFSLHLLHHRPPESLGVRITGFFDRDRDVDDEDDGAAEWKVVVLRGELEFMNAERAAKALQSNWDLWRTAVDGHHVVLDLSQVTGATPVALVILDALVATLAGQGVTVLSLDPHGRRMLASVAEEHASTDELVARHAACSDDRTRWRTAQQLPPRPNFWVQ